MGDLRVLIVLLLAGGRTRVTFVQSGSSKLVRVLAIAKTA